MALRYHLIASLGGHLALLRRVAPDVEGAERVWITSAGPAADGLLAQGEVVRTLPRLDRGSLTLRSAAAGAWLALKERPRVVVTSGAGLAVPFCLVSRLLGARLVYVESMARVTSASQTGRLLARFADALIVQWPEQAAAYPGAEVCAPAKLEGIAHRRAPGVGTFVTVGSHDQPFDRLLGAVADAARTGVLPAPVVVQRGVAAPLGGELDDVDFLPGERFNRAVHDAEVIVTHAGAGALATALRSGKRPLVMARSASRGEHVDDHQAELAGKLDELGLAVLVDGEITPEHVRRTAEWCAVDVTTGRPRVADRLSEVVTELLGRRRSWARRAPLPASRAARP